MNELTKDAKVVLSQLYYEYCNRIKHGATKEIAKKFTQENNILKGKRDEIKELVDAEYIQKDILGTVFLQNSAIIFFESLNKEKFKDWCGKAWEIIKAMPEIIALFL